LRSKEERDRRATNEKKGANSHTEKAAQAARGGAACLPVDSAVARRVGPEAEVPRGGDNVALVQPFSQKSLTPTVAKEFQIGLYDPVEADLELF